MVMSDNGPHYSSQEFKDFAKELCPCHKQSSLPSEQQPGGERSEDGKETTQIVKRPIPFLFVIPHNTTPMVQTIPSRIANGMSHSIKCRRDIHPEIAILGKSSDKTITALNGDKSQTLTDLIEPDYLPIYLKILRYGYVPETSRYLVK